MKAPATKAKVAAVHFEISSLLNKLDMIPDLFKRL